VLSAKLGLFVITKPLNDIAEGHPGKKKGSLSGEAGMREIMLRGSNSNAARVGLSLGFPPSASSMIPFHIKRIEEMRSAYLASGLICLALLVGCGGDTERSGDTANHDSARPATGESAATQPASDAPAASGPFQGSASGAVDVPSMSGTTAFWTTRAEGITFWVLNLYPKGAGEGRISLTRMNTSRPEAGEYPIGDEDMTGKTFGAVYVPADPSTSVKAMKGKLTIATSTSDKVTGSFEFDGLQADMKNLSAEGKPVTMKGTFTAECIGKQATGNVCE
jgi:hypothetical protein